MIMKSLLIFHLYLYAFNVECMFLLKSGNNSINVSSQVKSREITNYALLNQSGFDFLDSVNDDVILQKNQTKRESDVSEEGLNMEEVYSYVTIMRERRFLCSGCLISQLEVVTLASCVLDKYFDEDKIMRFRPYYPEELKIRMGSSSPFSGGIINYAADIRIHPDFLGDAYGQETNFYTLINRDLAVIKLTNPVKFTSTLKAAVISPEMKYFQDTTHGFECSVTGLVGDKVKENQPLVNIKMYIRWVGICWNYYEQMDPFYQFCATSGKTNNCPGDYGSGLYCHGKLVALAAWSEGCHAGKPTVFSRIDNTDIEFVGKKFAYSVSSKQFSPLFALFSVSIYLLSYIFV